MIIAAYYWLYLVITGRHSTGCNWFKGYNIHSRVQQVEVLSAELEQCRPRLRKQVDGLVVGLKMKGALKNVFHAENHAHLLQNHTRSFHRSVCLCVYAHACVCAWSVDIMFSLSALCYQCITCLKMAAG